MTRFRYAALIAILSACDHLPEDSPIGLVTVTPSEVYAGGTITLRSSDFRPTDSVQVFADTVALEIVLRDGDSIVARLPHTARGAVSLRVQDPQSPITANIDVAGYSGYAPITADIGFYLDVWPEGGAASIIGGNDQFDVLQLDPATGATRTVLSGFTLGGGGTRTPGRTPDPRVVLLQPRQTGNLQAWRLFPTPQLEYELPTTNPRHAALFNDSTVFHGFHHFVVVQRIRAGAPVWPPVYQGTYEETNEVILSPTNDRATLRVNGSVTGPPVFDMATGDTAYHVRQLYRSYGAAFSANGDTLWMIGATRERIQGPEFSISETMVLVLNARTGQELRRAYFPGSDLSAMRRDPDDGRLFIAAIPDFAPFAAPLDLLIVDETDLSLLGHVQVPRTQTCLSFCSGAVVAAGREGVFIVQSGHIFKFDYLQQY